MNKAFEKILDRLEEYENNDLTEHDSELCEHCKRIDCEIGMDCFICVMDKAKQIVQEVAEEYNNGWNPCSDGLPDDFMSMEYLTTVNGHFYPEINYYCVANHKWFSSRKTTKEVDVIAWKPLPEPYKERD